MLFNDLKAIFTRVPASAVLRDQLFEAERMHAEHAASAEHHAALAEMYERRIERIRNRVLSAKAVRISPDPVPMEPAGGWPRR